MIARAQLLPLAVVASLAALSFHCGGGTSSSQGSGGQAATSGECPAMGMDISAAEDLGDLDSATLGKLFDSDAAKCLTAKSTRPIGNFTGVPLCRTDVLPTYDDLPQGVKDVNGSLIALTTLRQSETFDNALASKIWHGKQFLPTMDFPSDVDPGINDDQKKALCHPGDAAQCGGVLNYIDILADGIGPATRRSANAVDFLDVDNKFVVLNYADATSGLRGFILSGVSTELITHVYDTVRIVNAEKGIYLGMAWLVDKPGVYEPNTKNTVPSCYFALQRQ